ncbi:S8 family peptidase [Xylanimonas sp. McL0601]|uniref:S8 family peptidase n=1 Tax=Xylanimonas sp. McL0601 TaxID=3414739 RepID=UPI003CEF522A
MSASDGWTARRQRDWAVRLQWRTRALDPSTAARAPRDESGVSKPLLQPTWYVGDRLLLDRAAPGEGDEPSGWFARLQELAAEHDLDAQLEPENYEDLRLLQRVVDELALDPDTAHRLRHVFGTSILLLPLKVGPQPDAWPLRTRLRDDAEEFPVALDHVIAPSGGIGGAPTTQPQPFSATQPFLRPLSMTAGHSMTTGHPAGGFSMTTGHPADAASMTTGHPVTGLSEYVVAGWGGRQPVAWVGPAPRGDLHKSGETPFVGADKEKTRRPVVALLDTGVGTHPWFGGKHAEHRKDVVVRDPQVYRGKSERETVVGLQPKPELEYQDPEVGGVSIDPLTGPLDPVAGHGTFMAGLVHQLCPDAAILSARVYGGSGIVPERNLLRSLRRLLLFHLRGLAGKKGTAPIDVLVLSLGYYHESPEDNAFDAPLRTVLEELQSWGVLVVCSTGNDGQVRETFPAAFAPRTDRRGDKPRYLQSDELDPKVPPVLAVGALNPDGSTALFSNDGNWVTCLRPGASLVSTAPRTMDGVVAPSRYMPELFSRGHRSTIDPEGFQGGFAVWSGTSFSAPVLAGELAGVLGKHPLPRPQDHEASARHAAASARAARVERAWKAIATVVDLPPRE